MHVNYEYLLNFIRKNSRQSTTRSLDYGCGRGEVVAAGRKEGLEIYGADLFHGNGKAKKIIKELGFLGSVVKEIKNDRIGFPDNYFDLVVNNQVFEHIKDIEIVLQEISRVLKPGGQMLSLFPPKETWLEGHSGIPFFHRVPQKSKLRFYYAYIWRLFGAGYHKGNKSRIQWSKDFCEYLDKYTFYRSQREIEHEVRAYFQDLTFMEIDYLLFRLNHQQSNLYPILHFMATIPFLASVLTVAFRKRAGIVFVTKKVSSCS